MYLVIRRHQQWRRDLFLIKIFYTSTWKFSCGKQYKSNSRTYLTFLNVYQQKCKYPGLGERTLHFHMRINLAHKVSKASLSINGLIIITIFCTQQKYVTFSGFGFQCVTNFSRLMESKTIPDFHRFLISKYGIILVTKVTDKKLTFIFTFNGRANLTQKPNCYQGKTIPIVNKCKLGLNFKIYHSPWDYREGIFTQFLVRKNTYYFKLMLGIILHAIEIECNIFTKCKLFSKFKS